LSNAPQNQQKDAFTLKRAFATATNCHGFEEFTSPLQIVHHMNRTSLFSRVQAGALFAAGLLSISSLASAYDSMVVFGDSLSDNGNLSQALGPDLFPLLDYDPMRLTSGPTTWPASSFTGVMVEHLGARLGLDPLVPATLGGTNYAWGLAETGFAPADLGNGTTPGTGLQVASYLANPALTISPDTLFVVWAGSNDLVNAATPEDIVAAEATASANLALQISALLDAGAKNLLWVNLPDLSLTPFGLFSTPDITDQLHASSLQFRNDWSNSLQQLRALHSDASIVGVDAYAFMHDVVSNPSLYGLTNVTDSAQGYDSVNPDEYLFWDSLHPTSRGHSLFADYAFQQLHPVPEPSGSVYLLVSLLGLIAYRGFHLRRTGAKAKS
jgi:phospholipase/lecithinase/hemolysin